MSIPEITFNRIAARIGAHWNPHEFNPHQAFMGTTGSGKSFLIRHGILPIAGPSRIVVIDVKPGGSRTWAGYGNEVTELKPGFSIGPDGTAHYHLMASIKKRAESFLEMIAAEGSCIVVIDDSRKVMENSPNYGLRTHVDNLLTLGRESGITVLACANSTIWGGALKDQCEVIWFGKMANEIQRGQFVKIAGLPKEVMPVIGSLKQNQFLYSDRYSGELRLALTKYEPNETQ